MDNRHADAAPSSAEAARKRNKNKWKQKLWKIRSQAKQILDLVAKLNDYNANTRQAIRWYQMQCDETARKFAEDESETGQRMYWRADGASDALEQLVSQFPDEPILAPSSAEAVAAELEAAKKEAKAYRDDCINVIDKLETSEQKLAEANEKRRLLCSLLKTEVADRDNGWVKIAELESQVADWKAAHERAAVIAAEEASRQTAELRAQLAEAEARADAAILILADMHTNEPVDDGCKFAGARGNEVGCLACLAQAALSHERQEGEAE